MRNRILRCLFGSVNKLTINSRNGRPAQHDTNKRGPANEMRNHSGIWSFADSDEVSLGSGSKYLRCNHCSLDDGTRDIVRPFIVFYKSSY